MTYYNLYVPNKVVSMHKNLNELMNEEIDLKRLDNLALTNYALKDKQYSMMCNIIRKAANFYSFVNEAKIASLASRLQERRIGAYELDKAIDRIIDHYEKFPPYKAIYELCVSYKKHGTPPEELTPEQAYLVEENEQLKKIEKNWNDLMGADRLPTYVKWWIKTNYNLDPDILESMALSVDMFKKPALFDWYDSGYSKDINKIREVFLKKKPKQLARMNNPFNNEYKRI